MKKLLFTLATLFAASLAVNAEPVLELAGPTNGTYNAETQELTLAPSASSAAARRAAFTIVVKDLDKSCNGFQMAYVITDENGEPMNTSNGAVRLRSVSGSYFRIATTGPTSLVGNGISENQFPDNGEYRMLIVNTSRGIVWVLPQDLSGFFTEDEINGYYDEDSEEDVEPLVQEDWTQYPADLATFEVMISASWEGQYANIKFVDADFGSASYVKYSFIDGSAYEEFDAPGMDIKVINADWKPATQDFAGEIVFGELDEATGNVPVSYNGPEEGVTLTVTVDGVAVDIVDGVINLGTYGEHTVTVTITAEGYNTDSRTKVFNWVEPVPEILSGEIVIGAPDENGKVSITYTGEEDVTITVTVNGEEVPVGEDGTITLTEGENTIVVTVTADGYETKTATAEYEYAPTPVTPDLPGYIIIGAPAANGEFYVNYLTGDYDGDYTMIVTINGEVVEANENGTYQAVEGENVVVVTIKANGYNDKVGTNTFDFHYPNAAPEPTFSWDAETYTMTATCEGHTVVLYLNGTEVENPYTAVQTAEDQYLNFSAMTLAADEDNNSAVVYYQPVLVPAKAVEYTAVPEVTVTITDDAYIFTATGDGEVTLYVNGEEVENPYTVARPETEPEEPYAVYVYATAKEEGKEMSQSAVQRVVIEAKPAPAVTATPQIIVTPDADNMGYTIEAVGDGEVHLYINGVEVENPYHVDRTAEAQELEVVATAQEAGKEMATATQVVNIPAFVGEGYYIVLVDQNGVEHQYPLYPSANNENNWVNMFTLEYDPWGSFDYEYYGEDGRPGVPFYFLVKGERLGAPTEAQPAAMGDNEQTMQNPLVATDYNYTVPVGYTYTIGIQINADGSMYVLVAQGGKTGVEELVAGKEVAGVRYFNMAGQEMQEANGICIAVTTYTDGTTTAVKVMK